MSAGPLDGVRIVDLTTMVSGPVATMLLGDQGADIVKVEAPGVGDLVRELGPKRGGISASFATSNRNKRSVVIDLKREEGREVLGKIVAGADVFVQNFRPGAAERMGVGEAAMREHRPDLIYVSISGFGERGPYAHQRVYDPVIQALSGLAHIQRDRESGRPKMIRTIIPDKVTALTAAQSITAALFARAQTGEGQHLRLAMLDAVIAFLWPEAMAGHTWTTGDAKTSRVDLAPDLIYPTADGYVTAATISDAEWERLLEALGRPAWAADERFQTAAGRVVHAPARIELVGKEMEQRTTAEWLERLDAAGVPCAPVLSTEEAIEQEQAMANELVLALEHPSGGPLRQARPAARFDRTPAGIRRFAPLLGEHTDEVLREAGVGEAELARLRASAAIA